MGAWIHLLEVISLLKPFSVFLLNSDQMVHYIIRLYDYCEQHEELHHLKIPNILKEIFPNLDFKIAITKSISLINCRPVQDVILPKIKLNSDDITVKKEPYLRDSTDLFQVTSFDLQNRVYEPKPLSVNDLQKYLPKVVSDLTKLEATWSNVLGLTITSINTAIPSLVEEKTSPLPPVDEMASAPASHPKKLYPERKTRKQPTPKTGREVVESLVVASRRKDIQIWYMNLVPSIMHNPYNLITTSKSTIKKEHVVMSVFGVLHVRQNGDSDLTSLGQWYMEAVCFDAMKNIPFFRNFFLIKAFRCWKQHKKLNQFIKLRRSVGLNYLHSIPSVPRTMLCIQQLLIQCEKISLLPLRINGKLDKDSIKELVTEHLTSQKRFLRKLFQSFSSILNKCHSDCVDYFNYCVAQLNADVPDHSSLAIVQKRKEKQQKNKQVASDHLKKFHRVTKLLNQMILSHFIRKLSEEIETFILREILGSKSGYFFCKLETDSSDVILSPSQEELFITVKNTIDDWLGELQMKYLVQMRLADGFTNAPVESQIQIETVTIEDIKKRVKGEEKESEPSTTTTEKPDTYQPKRKLDNRMMLNVSESVLNK